MSLNTKSNHLKLFILRFLIVSIPSVLIAFLFEKITLVVPTIAMFLIIANSIETGSNTNVDIVKQIKEWNAEMKIQSSAPTPYSFKN